ncbi:MAG: tRNA (adenosine(37)-N6)-threonylcarbamoyltransferase complex transferase subunit TsaD [Bacteriovoracaceae bacterium]|nr:tRNA (adenosine(37)-N6)-threonylcarbamoyltransferase complex transferase subunit TsaD [Bacteriovoracaceae bacterium]
MIIMKKLILGIETSCDDTSVSILKGDPGIYNDPPEVLAHSFFSQETILKKWGGVVPEIASRNHLAKLVPLLEETFLNSGTKPEDISLIGVTTHPGLLGPLLTGLNVAKTMSLLFQVAITPVNHLFAHLEAIHLKKQLKYPYLGLLISGGHSLYLLVNSESDFKIIGTTIDDAAGEAFDKGGKLLKLGYPAGKLIDELAKTGDPEKYEFPIGLRGSKNANLSFSGTKTSLRQFLEKNPDHLHDGTGESYSQKLRDVCASYQKAIIEALSLKLKFALKKGMEVTGIELPVVVGGGVACNSALRKVLVKRYNNVNFVEPRFCTDNGTMIANYALRTWNMQVAYPDCLLLDAKSRYINKQNFQTI